VIFLPKTFPRLNVLSYCKKFFLIFYDATCTYNNDNYDFDLYDYDMILERKRKTKNVLFS